jgi:DNA invertase Pin-like site-specific DNA recombinase
MYLIVNYKGKPLHGNTKGRQKNCVRSGKKWKRATDRDVIKMNAMRRKGHTLREIATALNISEYQVSVKSRKST